MHQRKLDLLFCYTAQPPERVGIRKARVASLPLQQSNTLLLRFCSKSYYSVFTSNISVLIMNSLPPEILMLVASKLANADVPNFRLVSRAFAHSGIGHIPRNNQIVMKPSQTIFKSLTLAPVTA